VDRGIDAERARNCSYPGPLEEDNDLVRLGLGGTRDLRKRGEVFEFVIFWKCEN
jgi:hypothetical protein